MEFDFRGSNGLTAGSVFLVPPAFPLIHSGIGSEYFVDVAAQCLFRPIRYSLSFGGSCPAAAVGVSFLTCSIQIERLGSLEYRIDRRFGGLTSLITDRGACDVFLEQIDLDLKSRSEGFIATGLFRSRHLAPVNPVVVASVPESDPIGSMSSTLEGVVPAVWLGSIVVLRKLRSVS
ncbi:hypothetical protein F2Q68_00042972 [Brassica cretica]|uniref:Uncharacterized protein n=1 Tax=Brassica cretica TaxID=69181 RepID=A0A8S9LER8_BRACR|nr:hypothetical protein F2Q68_00042972 [Brassica cretica]